MQTVLQPHTNASHFDRSPDVPYPSEQGRAPLRIESPPSLLHPYSGQHIRISSRATDRAGNLEPTTTQLLAAKTQRFVLSPSTIKDRRGIPNATRQSAMLETMKRITPGS